MARLLCSLTIAALVCGGCVPNTMYRPGSTPAAPDPRRDFFSHERLAGRAFDPLETADTGEWPYRLAFVEFDDQGEMFNRLQLDRAVAEIAAAKAEARAQRKRAVLAVFVHGWKNNASEASGNVWGFRQLLAGLSRNYDDTAGPVIGVYLGWRGAVVSAPILKEFTFFDRYRKAKNLPSAHLVEALLRMLQAAKGPTYDDPEPSPATLLIGHSFGGAVLETALTQTLLGMAVHAKNTGHRVRWPANLVLLVNEAQEALRSYQLIESFARNLPPRNEGVVSMAPGGAGCVPSSAQVLPEAPLIVSVSSTGDIATRVAFTGAQSLRRPFNSLRRYDDAHPNLLGFSRQTPMFLGTTAHRAEFQSHLMGRCQCTGVTVPGSNRCQRPEDLVCEDAAVEAARQVCAVDTMTTLGEATYLIVEKPHTRNRTPYWVMQMPPSVVPDHSTIFTPVFRNFIVTLLNRTTISSGPSETPRDTTEGR